MILILIALKNIKLSLSPDGSKYPFGLEFSPKDIAYSGSEVVMKNYSYAPN
jgi:hypothetical protein